MKILQHLILSLLILNYFVSSAQTNNKPNIVLQEFTASNGYIGQTYQPVLLDLTFSKLVNLNKFNIIKRTPEMWRAIENELAIQDFIDPKTAIHLGKMLSAKFYIEGNVSQFTCERKTNTVNNTIQYYHSCVITATLKILNLESGQYEESITSESTIDNADRETAIHQAMNKISTDLAMKISKSFLLQASIKKIIEPDLLVIDKGYLEGVKNHDIYIVNELNENAISFRIINTSEHEANGRLLKGNFRSIKVGSTAVESVHDESNVVKIEKIEKTEAYINAGSDLDIKPGDIFLGTEKKEIQIGDRIVIEEKTIGKIYVKEVRTDYSKVKIINGYKNLHPGSILVHSKSKEKYKIAQAKLRYKSPLGINIKANSAHGTVTVVNEAGSFDIDTKYLNSFQSIKNVGVISVGIGSKNLANDVSTMLYCDIYNIGSLNTWILSLNIDYDYYLIPESLSIYFGGSIGYGGMKQSVPGNYVSTISNQNDEQLKSQSIFLSGDAGINLRLRRFTLGAGISYDYMVFNKWNYDVIDADKTTKKSAPNEIIPYANVNLSGIYFNGALAYALKK